MTRIALIRHGQTEWNTIRRYQGQSNTALSEEGLEQARRLAEHFPLDRLDGIYSSDLQRAMSTAQAVAEKFSLDVHPEPALREMDFGDWEGMTYQELMEKWPKDVQDFFQRPDRLHILNGEDFHSLQRRAVGRISEIVRENDGRTLAVFAHGAVLRTILSDALHMPLRYIWSIRQDNTAVNIVNYEKDGALVELVNSTAHLR